MHVNTKLPNSLLGKANLISLLKTSFYILNTHLSNKSTHNLNIEQSVLFFPPLTPIPSESMHPPNVFNENVLSEYEANLLKPPEQKPIISKIVLKSTVSLISNDNQVSKEMPLLSEKEKLKNIIIKKLAHVQEKSKGSTLMNNTKRNVSKEQAKKYETEEEAIDVSNISILLERNLTRNYTPDNKTTNRKNKEITKSQLTPTKKSMIKQSQINHGKGNRNIKAKQAKVPQVEFKVDFNTIIKHNNDIKFQKKPNLIQKK